MKLKILALTFAMTACLSTPQMLETDSAFGRTVDRVVDRHDSYVLADESLSGAAKGAALDQSAQVHALILMPEVQSSVLKLSLVPVMARHDVYVLSDGSLDELERDVYLKSTERIRAIFDAAQGSEE